METNNEMKLLTLIFDEALKHTLENEIVELGAKGYTITEVEGRGQSGERFDHWTGTNIKIETIVPKEVMFSILNHVRAKYLDRYPLIAYSYDVSVIRTQHF